MSGPGSRGAANFSAPTLKEALRNTAALTSARVGPLRVVDNGCCTAAGPSPRRSGIQLPAMCGSSGTVPAAVCRDDPMQHEQHEDQEGQGPAKADRQSSPGVEAL